MVHMGVVRAEGTSTAAVLAGDKFVIQRFGVSGASYWQPFEALVTELLAGSLTLAMGTATLVAGTVTVALPAITAGSKIQLTEASATPNALGYTINAGVGFTITSASGADTSVVSYTVFS
jgi:hypothetical protein